MNYSPVPWRAFMFGKVVEVHDSNGKPVVPWPGFDESSVPLKAHKANAYLIAAAPDLLAACEKALKGYRNLLEFKLLPSSAYEEEIKDFIIPSMEAAIAKVKGQDA